ncbi:MAG: sigma-54 dependent transcriptional regulator [Candidatus Korobacteraceae bacterium]
MYPSSDRESANPSAAIRPNTEHFAHRHFGHRGGISRDGFAKGDGASLVADCNRGAEPIDPFLGTSRVIQRLRDFSFKVALSDSPVLLLGETGSGKGVLANWLHANGNRRQEEFLDLNCAGLDREFLETELFGHEKGAFTSAVAAKPGLLEVANHGTVFLDEIGDVDLQVQPKLLKVLETGRFRRLGEVRDRFADVRLISATHRDLTREVCEGRFRSDLFYRINIIVLEVPSLRSRCEDIPLLVKKLLRCLGPQGEDVEVDGSALEALRRYSWPGNIRELCNVLQRALLLSEDKIITERELHFFPARFEEAPLASSATDLTLREMEKAHIAKVLAQESGSVQRTAKRLGIPRSSLYNKLNRFGICNGEL